MTISELECAANVPGGLREDYCLGTWAEEGRVENRKAVSTEIRRLPSTISFGRWYVTPMRFAKSV